MNSELENIFMQVQKPGRYTGGELNSVVKDKNAVAIRFAFAFPDLYEVGMSHLGMKLLYGLLDAQEDIWVFAPDTDMEQQMRENGVALFGLESREPIADFDFIGFTLQYELSFTTILHMLDLAGLPLRAADRGDDCPLVIGGGPCACNPEPLVDFFDLFTLGEGEEVNLELMALYRRHKAAGFHKAAFLRDAAQIEGVYVPSLYEVSYRADGTIEAVRPLDGAPSRVRKRIIADMDAVYFPEYFVVPFLDIVHDRAMSEIFRGCIRGCRFCQAGFIYRPVREKSPEVIDAQSRALCASTGYEEFSLSSLSTSDYSRLEELLPRLLDWAEKEHTNISLPSLRVDGFSEELANQLNVLRRSGLTFAPEAGTQRLRDVINKNLTEDEILTTCANAFSGGWNNVKLYFMLGLPTETDEDVLGIAELVYKVILTWKEHAVNKKRGLRVHVATAYFVPKPHTPFQWEQQITPQEYLRRCRLLKSHFYSKSIEYDYHAPDLSQLEAVFARGDRRLGAVIEEAVKNGARLDGWDEYFDYAKWQDAFRKCGVDGDFYTVRGYGEDELLPWDTIDVGVTKKFLKLERKRAYEAKITPDCRHGCAGCGAERLLREVSCDA